MTSCFLFEKRDHLVLSEARLSIAGSNCVVLFLLGTTYHSQVFGGKVEASRAIFIEIL